MSTICWPLDQESINRARQCAFTMEQDWCPSVQHYQVHYSSISETDLPCRHHLWVNLGQAKVLYTNDTQRLYGVFQISWVSLHLESWIILSLLYLFGEGSWALHDLNEFLAPSRDTYIETWAVQYLFYVVGPVWFASRILNQPVIRSWGPLLSYVYPWLIPLYSCSRPCNPLILCCLYSNWCLCTCVPRKQSWLYRGVTLVSLAQSATIVTAWVKLLTSFGLCMASLLADQCCTCWSP